MNKFILITPDKMRFILSDKEYKAFLEAVRNKERFVIIQGSTISLQIIPSVTPFEIWYANENERLALTNKRLCKKCLSIMQDICKCWEEFGLGEKKNAFKIPELPEAVKLLLQDKVSSLPKVTEADVKDEIVKDQFKNLIGNS